MYTTAQAVRLLFRLRLAHPEETCAYAWEINSETLRTLVDLEVVALTTKTVGSDQLYWIALTELGELICTELEKHTEMLLAQARRATDLQERARFSLRNRTDEGR